MQDKITIYTDGSCLGNPGPGGWAALIMQNGREIILKGGEPDTTNNRMEMAAIINALVWLNKNIKSKTAMVELFSDSNLIIQSLTKGWKRKANIDLWEKIDRQLSMLYKNGIFINWNWVKGHGTNRFNSRVDEIAVKESKNIKYLKKYERNK